LNTCFVSAPAGFNLAKIKKIIIQKDFEFINASDIFYHGKTISEKINNLISLSDLFIAVFDKKLENGNILFELGIAVAHKKQIIIIAPPNYRLPSDLNDFLILNIPQDNIEALGFAIDQFLEAADKTMKKRERKSFIIDDGISKPVGNKIIEFKNRLNNMNIEDISENKLVNFVGDLLKEVGISVIQHSHKPDLTADFAIWSDDLGAILGNPILIEIKKNIWSRSQASKVTNKLIRYIEKTNSKSAIVFYLNGLSSIEIQKYTNQYNIIFYQLGDFIEQLQSNSFSDTLRIHRNIIAHGEDV